MRFRPQSSVCRNHSGELYLNFFGVFHLVNDGIEIHLVSIVLFLIGQLGEEILLLPLVPVYVAGRMQLREVIQELTLGSRSVRPK